MHFGAKRKIMTSTDLLSLCGEFLIDPLVALENDDLKAAYERSDYSEVQRILFEEF